MRQPIDPQLLTIAPWMWQPGALPRLDESVMEEQHEPKLGELFAKLKAKHRTVLVVVDQPAPR